MTDYFPLPIKLRGRQPEFLEAIDTDLNTFSRVLAVAPGGVGKSTLAAALAHRFHFRGIKTLVLENRDRLTRQIADQIAEETALNVEVEMGDSHASPHADIVVASVQSLGRTNRLLGFSDTHFGLIIVDECHFCLAPQWRRIMDFFHYSAESLASGWQRPKDGFYAPKAKLVGFTASPDLGTSKNLGDVFQKLSVNYSYLEAIEDGWLVSLKEINVPVKIDTRKFRVKRNQEGASFDVSDQAAMMEPIIEELADQIIVYAPNRKGIMFVPSLEIARTMADALNRRGIRAIFVSGECIDKGPKTDAFAAAGKNTWLINCALYTYGVNFIDVDAVAPFGAILSKVKYIQAIYRCTRVLRGIVNDEMTADERRAAIAMSHKPYSLILSPFYISDRIHIMEAYDLFGMARPPGVAAKAEKDFTDPAKIRDYIEALNKAADKHSHKQARTIDPVKFSLSIGADKLAAYVPENAADAEPATKEQLDFLLEAGLDTTLVKCSGQANQLVDTLRERERLGLASPKAIGQLTLRLHWPPELASMMKSKQAGVMIWKGIHYRTPSPQQTEAAQC